MSERLQIIRGHIGHDISRPTISACPVSSLQTAYQPSSQYKFTLENPLLTQQQRSFFEENGYLIIPNLVPKEDLDKYRNRFDEICRGEVEVPGLIVMKDIASKDKALDQRVLNKIQNFAADDVLFQFCCHPNVVDYAKCFCGPNVLAQHTMLINKPPDTGNLTSRHPMHQDLHYFPFRPAERIVCAWTAMQKVDRENGCLVVVPGTHKGELMQHDYPRWEGGVNKMFHGILDYDPSMSRFHAEMNEGDTIFFHPILLHGSGVNKTNDFRKAISCHYSAAEVEYIDIDENHTQANIAKEVLERAEKVIGKEAVQSMAFKDIWKMTCRLVAGVETD